MKNYWIERHETSNLNLYEVDDGEQHWYSASSIEEAKEMHLNPMRDPDTGEINCDDYGIDDLNDIEISQVLSDQIIGVRMDDEDGEVVYKTAAKWCDRKGLIASTMF